MHDETATLQQLKDLINSFVTERGWQHHHRPKHLAMSIAIEAAELMEHFQWTDPDGGLDDARFKNAQDKDAVAEELCDVLAYTLSMANQLDLDLSATFAQTMRKNAVKYPVETDLPAGD